MCPNIFTSEALPPGNVARVIDEVDSGANVEIIAELITDRQFDILKLYKPRPFQQANSSRVGLVREYSQGTCPGAMLQSLGLTNRTRRLVYWGRSLVLAESADVDSEN